MPDKEWSLFGPAVLIKLQELLDNPSCLTLKASPGIPLAHTCPSVGYALETKRGEIITMVMTRLKLWFETPLETILAMDGVELVEGFYRDPVRIFIKDEPHSHNKYLEQRWRIIFSVSLIDSLCERMMHSNLNNYEKSFYTHGNSAAFSPSTIGMSLHERSHESMYKILRFGTPGAKSVDVSFHDWSVDEVDGHYEAELRIFQNKLSPSGPVANAMRNEAMIMMHGLIITGDGQAYQRIVRGMMESGRLITSSSSGKIRFMEAANAGAPWCMCQGDDSVEGSIGTFDEAFAAYRSIGKKIKMYTDEPEFCSNYWTQNYHYSTNPQKVLFRLLQQPENMRTPETLAEFIQSIGKFHPELRKYLDVIDQSGWKGDNFPVEFIRHACPFPDIEDTFMGVSNRLYGRLDTTMTKGNKNNTQKSLRHQENQIRALRQQQDAVKKNTLFIKDPKPPRGSLMSIKKQPIEKVTKSVTSHKAAEKIVCPQAIASARLIDRPFDYTENSAYMPITGGEAPCRSIKMTVRGLTTATVGANGAIDGWLCPEGTHGQDNSSSIRQIGLSGIYTNALRYAPTATIYYPIAGFMKEDASSAASFALSDSNLSTVSGSFSPLSLTTNDSTPNWQIASGAAASDSQKFKVRSAGVRVRYNGKLQDAEGFIEFWKSYEYPGDNTLVYNYATNSNYKRVNWNETRVATDNWKPNCESVEHSSFLNTTVPYTFVGQNRWGFKITAPVGAEFTVECIIHYEVVFPLMGGRGSNNIISNHAGLFKTAIASAFDDPSTGAMAKHLLHHVTNAHPLLRTIAKGGEAALAALGGYEGLALMLAL